MDYEKKYKEVLEKANTIITDEKASPALKNWLKNSFPELAPSEDEIKQAIISYINDEGLEDGEWFGVRVRDILVWLEQ